jgi:hypothetical protein
MPITILSDILRNLDIDMLDERYDQQSSQLDKLVVALLTPVQRAGRRTP